MIQITMPRLSDTMEDGLIVSWHKKPGDEVKAGEIIVEIETDKAIMEFEAYDSGVLTSLLVPEGERASIGTPIAELDGGSDDMPTPASADVSKTPSPGADPVVPAEPSAPVATVEPDTSKSTPATIGTEPGASTIAEPAPRLRATPLVRTLARERGLDLNTITGTGPGGRIIRADVEPLTRPRTAEVEEAPAELPKAMSGGMAQEIPEVMPEDRRNPEEVPLSSVRRVIARRLGESAQTIPHFYVTSAADVDELVTLRNQVNATLTAAGRDKISINDLLVRACALALREHPHVNASYRGDDATTMLVHRRMNIGVAVASENGLVVPVINDVDEKTVTQVSAETRRLVALSIERKLSPAQMAGGTFTISNLGMYGVEEFTAIINPPEGAILAVGATSRQPAVVDDEVVIRQRMRYTLSADHRIIDGALAAQFLRTLTRLLEHPWTILA